MDGTNLPSHCGDQVSQNSTHKYFYWLSKISISYSQQVCSVHRSDCSDIENLLGFRPNVEDHGSGWALERKKRLKSMMRAEDDILDMNLRQEYYPYTVNNGRQVNYEENRPMDYAANGQDLDQDS